MKSITKYYIFLTLSLLSISATFASEQIICETHANKFLFEKKGAIFKDVKSNTINRCSNSPLVTEKSDCLKNIKCFDNSVAEDLISCSTHSKGRTFRADNTHLSKSQTSVLKQCRNNPYTNQNQCYDNLVCHD